MGAEPRVAGRDRTKRANQPNSLAPTPSFPFQEPLGFKIDDARLKRAGLDYWASVAGATFPSWSAFEAAAGPRARFVAFSTRGTTHYATPGVYQPLDGGTTYLIFGSETAGLPPEAHAACAARGAVVTLPIDTRHVRSLNLAVSAGVGIYEALRQLDGCG